MAARNGADPVKLNPRTRLVTKARNDLTGLVIKLQEQHDLTDIELLGILIDETQNVHKYVLREERHPGEPDRKADEE